MFGTQQTARRYSLHLSGDHDAVQCLLEHGADVDLPEKHRTSPLTVAACCGHINVAWVPVEHNANDSSMDGGGRTPLQDTIWDAALGSSSRGDYPHLERMLLEHLVEHCANVYARDTNGWTLLHLASMGPSKLDLACVLLEHGSEVDAEDWNGKPPLQVALEHGQGTGLVIRRKY